MDDVDSVLLPKPKQRRQKDPLQNELKAKLYHRRTQGLTADITDSDDDIQSTSYSKEYQSSYSNRPGSAKRRPDKSPDLSRGLGTTTMRARDLTQLLHQNSGHLDEDDDDEEIMAANLSRSNALGSYKSIGAKTPSPQHDSKYQRKTPTRESPKDGSRLESIYGRRTPTSQSPKEQGKLDSLFGRKTPTKDSSPRTLTKEDIIFGRKTPTSSSDGHRFPGMDGGKDGKPWQPPSFRSVSPNSPTEHSRGSRGVTPTDSALEPIEEGLSDRVTPRFQRGEKLRDVSPRQYGDRPIPQSRSKAGDRKSPLADRTSPLLDKKSPYDDKRKLSYDDKRKSPYDDKGKSLYDDKRKSPYDDKGKSLYDDKRKSLYDDKRKSPLDDKRKSPYDEKKSSIIDRNSSPSKDSSGLKRATPTYDLFGKSRTSASQEVEDFIQSGKKTDPKYGRSITKSPDGRKMASDSRKYPDQEQEKGQRLSKSAGNREIGQKTSMGKKTPTDFKRDYDRKFQGEKEESLRNRKSPQTAGSSLLDFLTEGSNKTKTQTKDGKGRKLDDEIDDMFGRNEQYLSRKSPTHKNKVAFDQRKSPIDQHRPSLKKSADDQKRRTPDHLTKQTTFDDEYSKYSRRSPDMFEPSDEKPRKIPKSRKEDESSVCEEIPLDPNLQRARAEEKALKTGKETTERAKANHAIDSIAEAQTMKYIEPAKKIRPVTAQAKVQHRPKPRYGTLPGTQTQDQERQFSSTSDIREAIYEQWYAERQKSARKKKKEEEKKKAEEEEKKKKEEQERIQEAQLSYKAWLDKKKETVFQENAKKKHQEEEKKHQEYQEKQEKEEEAIKTFQHWKEKKDAMIRHELHKKKRAEEEKLRQKEEEEYVKRKDRETAFKGWKSKKEREFQGQKLRYKQDKENAKKKKEEERENQRRKEEEAMDKYYEWMDAKEKQAQLEKKRSKQRIMSEEDNYKPAWFPASRTIPFGR